MEATLERFPSKSGRIKGDREIQEIRGSASLGPFISLRCQVSEGLLSACLPDVETNIRTMHAQLKINQYRPKVSNLNWG